MRQFLSLSYLLTSLAFANGGEVGNGGQRVALEFSTTGFDIIGKFSRYFQHDSAVCHDVAIGHLCDLDLEALRSAALKARLKKNLEELRSRATQPSERLKWPFPKDSEIQSVYYSSWTFAAIHIIVSIPRYQSPEKIAERLGLPMRRVQEIINWLVGAKLIKKTSQGFSVLEAGLHLKNTSHLIEMHHTQWRHQALTNLQRGDSEAVHYSAVFAMSRDDFAKLKTMAMGFLKEATGVITPSKSEEAYSVGFDLFQV